MGKIALLRLLLLLMMASIIPLGMFLDSLHAREVLNISPWGPMGLYVCLIFALAVKVYLCRCSRCGEYVFFAVGKGHDPGDMQSVVGSRYNLFTSKCMNCGEKIGKKE